MPISIGSYLLLSSAAKTPPAETQEISCSLDRPPKMIAITFFMRVFS